MNLKEIYDGAQRLLTELISDEFHKQGHTLTGKMAESITAKQKKDGRVHVLEGQAIKYTDFVNDGFPAKSASMKQFPFVKAFFILRGLGDAEAGGAAAATIKKWMKEGMSTFASRRFSKTGARQKAIEKAFSKNTSKLHNYMTNTFDFAVDELYKKEKTETV